MSNINANADTETKPEVAQQTTPSVAPTRDEIRAQILGSKAQSKVIEFFGAKIELRQPTLGVILEHRKASDDLDALQMMLISYAYVPDTTELVFDEADVDALMELPFGKDMNTLTTAVGELMGQDIKAVEAAITDATKSD